MIECRNVSLKYGKKKILSDISFTAEAGQVTVVLGKNGSGKSSLFKAITGNISYQGSMMLDGKEVSLLKSVERARQAAMMPQILSTPQITVRELISYGRQPYTGISGILSARDKEIVAQAIEEAGVSNLTDCYVDSISGGERQKVFFAMLLAQETPVLLLDEPTSNLDAEYTKRMAGFIRFAAEKGKTVLISMHDMNAALDIADQILLLGDEKMLYFGEKKTFMESGLIEKIFGLTRTQCVEYK